MDAKESLLTHGVEVGSSKVHTQATQALQDVVFGSIAGIAGKFVEYPFDTVKVRLQSQPSEGVSFYKGPLDCFRQSIKQDGWLSLYRGISAPLVGAAIENSSLFFSYRLAQNALQATVYGKDSDLPLQALICCGAISGAFSSFLLTPIELVKCKMQVPAGEVSASGYRQSPLNLIASIFRTDGIRGFWHGQMGTLIRETGGSAAWFGSFEGVSLFFHSARKARNPSLESSTPLAIHEQLLAGASAGIAYNFLFYPADTIKSRMQTEAVGLTVGGRKKTFLFVGKALWRTQGLRGLYNGCGITVARAAPSSAFIFTIYQTLIDKFALK